MIIQISLNYNSLRYTHRLGKHIGNSITQTHRFVNKGGKESRGAKGNS